MAKAQIILSEEGGIDLWSQETVNFKNEDFSDLQVEPIFNLHYRIYVQCTVVVLVALFDIFTNVIYDGVEASCHGLTSYHGQVSWRLTCVSRLAQEIYLIVIES